jgi:hypothetical protein
MIGPSEFDERDDRAELADRHDRDTAQRLALRAEPAKQRFS